MFNRLCLALLCYFLFAKTKTKLAVVMHGLCSCKIPLFVLINEVLKTNLPFLFSMKVYMYIAIRFLGGRSEDICFPQNPGFIYGIGYGFGP